MEMLTRNVFSWQVAQATSLQNIVFEMDQGGNQNGIFMDNGSGGFYSDLIFNGGNYGSKAPFKSIHPHLTPNIYLPKRLSICGNADSIVLVFVGNQQFTTRNLTFNNCKTGVYMNWNWVWSLKSVTFNNCGVGVNSKAPFRFIYPLTSPLIYLRMELLTTEHSSVK